MTTDFVRELLAKIDVQLNGNRPWDIQVHNDNLLDRCIRNGSLGFGEAYMEGWWDCEAIDELFYRILRGGLEEMFRRNLATVLTILAYRLCNLQSIGRAFQVGQKHYDLGNDIFEAMLDSNMQYSCGWWGGASSLEEAQLRKMELIARKLKLAPGMKVLDVGCGWGGLGIYLAKHHGVQVTGITVSREQAAYAAAHSEGLPVRWLLEDYRSLTDRFDRIVSVGMFEHVGHKNYATFMDKMRELLEPEGLFLLHTIGSNIHRESVDPWIRRYIFPNGILPSIRTIGMSLENRFVLEDWHSFGKYYDLTLMAWEANFRKGAEEGRFHVTNEVYRMFRYYLLSCAAAFRARDIQLWQLVLTPRGLPGAYERPTLDGFVAPAE